MGLGRGWKFILMKKRLLIQTNKEELTIKKKFICQSVSINFSAIVLADKSSAIAAHYFASCLMRESWP